MTADKRKRLSVQYKAWAFVYREGGGLMCLFDEGESRPRTASPDSTRVVRVTVRVDEVVRKPRRRP